jgi:hypothetical protein
VATVVNRAFERTMDLPQGYRVTFGWSGIGGVWALWEPAIPQVRSLRHRRKFLAAFEVERDDFARDVATCIRWPILVQTPDGFRVIEPGVRH